MGVSLQVMLLQADEGKLTKQEPPPPPSETLPLPEIWSENNSITKEICTTIDFAPPLKKIPRRKPEG